MSVGDAESPQVAGPPRAPRGQRFLAGVAAGALGGSLLLTVMALASMAGDDPWWRYPNLLGTTFYGGFALRSGVGLPTLAGIALQLLICGSLGAVFSLALAGVVPGGRLTLIGILTGILSFRAAELVYARTSPLIPLYSATFPMTIGHGLFGAFLAACLWFLPKRTRQAPPEVITPVPDATVEDHSSAADQGAPEQSSNPDKAL